ncbi:hypothetical protein SPI_00632 [Niveomyces insectorum RCEF 264]|uniref:Mitochondrial K+-H+ exchange-related-domain-containing protein n=1 Tax=Niveomyces insectorum RCEF 264 TaxID=1081102 RepID=A0A168A9J7_9HYPO|nr:hypothetical protein SPI_00632 [Niveomyces insectorum RCEF 264]
MNMRLFLLPVSTRRTLLYCERLGDLSGQQQTLMDKAQTRAARLWANWEKKPAGSWQQRVVTYGNAGLRRIALEEWGLKSVPSLSSRRRAEAAAAAAAASTAQSQDEVGSGPLKPNGAPTASLVEVVYPPSVISSEDAPRVLRRLGTEREALHRQRLIWCFVGMPITAPIAIIPLVPNLPFFYLVYRAWSHWRALSGGKHIQHLLENKELYYSPSPMLDEIYAQEGGTDPSANPLRRTDGNERIAKQAAEEKEEGEEEEKEKDEEEELPLLSHPGSSQAIAKAFESPQLVLELERAIWQVETSLKKRRQDLPERRQQERRKQPDKRA